MTHLLALDDDFAECGVSLAMAARREEPVIDRADYPLHHYGDEQALEAALARVDCDGCRRSLEREPGDGVPAAESPSYRTAMKDAGRGGMLR